MASADIGENWIALVRAVAQTLSASSSLWILLTTTGALLIGLLIDHLRFWFLKDVFTKHANFWGLFGRWWRLHYIKTRLTNSKLLEEDKNYEYWHSQYTEAYDEAYKLWWELALERNPHAVALADRRRFSHALYAMNKETWSVNSNTVKAKDKSINITNGQIWPILATRRKDAFRFHQEYFLSDLSANVLVVFGLAFLLSVARAIGSAAGPASTRYAEASVVYGVLYIVFAQVAARQQIAQLRFFRFVLLYDAVGALDERLSDHVQISEER